MTDQSPEELNLKQLEAIRRKLDHAPIIDVESVQAVDQLIVLAKLNNTLNDSKSFIQKLFGGSKDES